MSTTKPQLKTYVNATTYTKFKEIAKLENRSASNFLEYIIEREIKVYEAEHGEIQTDRAEH